MKNNKKITYASNVAKRGMRSALVMLLFLGSGCLSGHNPGMILDSITARFLRYCSLFPREEIYVHTDREEYIAGENIWFKLYLFDGQAGKLSSSSGIAYFEILNPGNNPVVQKRIKLGNGLGSGLAVLSDTLSSGTYTIRAYTSGMKNFMPGNCFIKRLNVYNALNTGTFRGVAGLAPEIREAENSVSSSVNEASSFGVEINNLSEGVELIIRPDNSFRSANNDKCCLFVQTRGNIDFREVVSLTSDRTVVMIPKAALTPGVNHITLFSSSGKPLAERFAFTPPDEKEVLFLSDPGPIGIREKVVLEFQMNNGESPSGEAGDLSISVIPSGSRHAPGIAAYISIGSEFGEVPGSLLNGTSGNATSASIESSLMNTGSNRFAWDVVLSGNFPEILYETERERHYIRGQLLDRSGQGSGKGRYLFLSVPGKNAVFQYSLSDEEGWFEFSLPIDEGISDLIIQPENPGLNDVIRMEPAFLNKYPASVPVFSATSGTSVPYIRKWGVNYQLRRIYRADSVLLPVIPESLGRPAKRFYGKPEIELSLKDFIDLPVMEEVFYELLDGVQLRRRKSANEIIMTDPVYNKPYEKPPVMFIDGVVVNDPSVIAGLEPVRAEKIDVIRSRYVVGDYLFFGLVNIITKTGDFSYVALPGYAVRLPYRIFDPQHEFWSPSYADPESRQSRIPDLRNTLYWNPSVRPDRDGRFMVEFWSSDYVTDYEIIVQGTDSRGKPVSFMKTIKAK